MVISPVISKSHGPPSRGGGSIGVCVGEPTLQALGFFF